MSVIACGLKVKIPFGGVEKHGCCEAQRIYPVQQATGAGYRAHFAAPAGNAPVSFECFHHKVPHGTCHAGDEGKGKGSARYPRRDASQQRAEQTGNEHADPPAGPIEALADGRRSRG